MAMEICIQIHMGIVFFTPWRQIQARAICPSDPLVYNELGVVAYHMKEYQKAAQWFEMTLVNVSSSMSEIWEPTVVNLAHAQRKLKMYQKAISSYEKALALSTRSLSAYAGLAYTYHLMDNLDSAVKFYHKALCLKPEDQFCTEMLTMALEEQGRSGSLVHESLCGYVGCC
ncbi:hypothetical protein HPP92_003781 [Vanilla planifolia]|uniref:Uncharacterized protein n=1 Tax=Vanilla planifolia TaxID=51239 RepID=A0A835VK93_VANPL|nr:hypothetical protein HPP92_003781 [Vanilla planifolia]